MNNPLCLIYNFAPHYRKGIFTLIDREYDCTWYFGDEKTDIKPLDLSLLHDAHIVNNRRIFGSYYWQQGCFSLLFQKRFDTYFILGDTHSLTSWALLYAKKLLCPRKRIYVWTHGWYGKEGWLKRLMKKAYYKMTDGVFLYGNYARGLMIQNGFDGSKLFTLHNSLDYHRQLELRALCKDTGICRTHFNNANPNLVFIGRLTATKRLDLILDAMATLKDKGEYYNLILIGDGTEKTALQQKAEQLHIANNVWFYGACYDEAENAELIYNADLCVAPGNVGLTAMHSMVFGTPVATHDSFEWQMPEFESIQEGITGTFFKRNDVSSIATSISRWFSDHTDREAVRTACYHEIDTQWTPEFQISVIKEHLQF